MTNSTSPAMQILAGASGVLINQSHFSNIEGNQYNYYMTDKTQSKKKTITGDLLELSEFTQVKRGDIYKDRDVCYSWRLCSNGKDETEAAVYYAEINIAGSFGQKKFTVKAYHGRNAKKEWRRDFLRCSTNEDVPLFGYNQSSVPSLIFYGELIPMALIVEGLGLVGHLYIAILRTALECSTSELWMDPTKGGFCRGPAGPQCRDQVGDFRGIAIPSDVEFLKEDVLIRYLSNTKHDGGLLWALNYSGHFETGKEISPPYYPQIISSLTNSTMAFTRNVQWSSWKDCLCDRSIMADGMTRFLLRNKRRSIEVKSAGVTSSWLSQAFHVFHAHNIQSQDFSRFKLVHTGFELRGTLQRSRRKRQRRELYGPIYLFLEPSPSLATQFYFWSHSPSGGDPLSLDLCKYLGLPFKLFLASEQLQFSWPSKVYRALHDYQVRRGFDPKTTEFARSLRRDVYEVVSPRNHSREVLVSMPKEARKRSRFDALFDRFIGRVKRFSCIKSDMDDDD